MGFNIQDDGGTSVGGGRQNLDTWTFTLTKGEGITTAGGDFNENSQGVPPIDESLGLNEYEFLAPTGDFADAVTLTVDGAGTGGGTNSTGIYSFSVDFSQITEDTIIEITVIGRRLNEDGSVRFEDEDTIIIELLICIARGTLVETPRGALPVESLAIGDEVRTVDGRSETIRWIGSRKLGCKELKAAPDLRPVRICKGALGPGAPDRDLLVSPQHRVLLQGWKAELLFGEAEVLAPARGLVNDRTIRVDASLDEIEYFHLLCGAHEIIVTNNLPTESFFPGETSLKGISAAARDELFRILPDLATRSESYGAMAEPGLRTWETRVVERTSAS